MLSVSGSFRQGGTLLVHRLQWNTWLLLACAMSATASAGVIEGCHWGVSLLSDKLVQLGQVHAHSIRILSSFFGVTTIGAHHSVGSVTGAMMPWRVSRSISLFSLSLYANGTVWGVVTQRDMQNFSPGVVRIWPSKTEGNSNIIASAVKGTDSFSLNSAPVAGLDSWRGLDSWLVECQAFVWLPTRVLFLKLTRSSNLTLNWGSFLLGIVGSC